MLFPILNQAGMLWQMMLNRAGKRAGIIVDVNGGGNGKDDPHT